MSSYKNYMDRIKLDDEQHEKLLEAVRAAEEKQASGASGTPQPAKVRRFPVKRLALIASAAAVIILAVGVIPGIGEKRRADLLKRFKTVSAVGQASLAELQQVLPKDAAMAVWKHFHQEEETP